MCMAYLLSCCLVVLLSCYLDYVVVLLFSAAPSLSPAMQVVSYKGEQLEPLFVAAQSAEVVVELVEFEATFHTGTAC